MEEQQRAYYAIIPANVRYDKSLPMGAKLLYGEITALCRQEGFCWAKNKYFCELYEVSESTIIRWINALTDRGYLLKNIEYEDDGKTFLRRCLSIPNVTTPLQNCNEGTVKNETTPPCKNATYINNTSINNTSDCIERNLPTEDTERRSTGDTSSVDGTALDELNGNSSLLANPSNSGNNGIGRATSNSNQLYQQMVSLYHEICISLPRIKALTDKRKSSINGRVRNGYKLDSFTELFQKAQASSFLTGNNDRGWKADFDWLLNPNNFVKVLEGKYDDKNTAQPNSGEYKRNADGSIDIGGGYKLV